jgi:hypothetical protein
MALKRAPRLAGSFQLVDKVLTVLFLRKAASSRSAASPVEETTVEDYRL